MMLYKQTKAALEEGIVPGGGAALLHAREHITQNTIGASIVYKTCASPFKKSLLMLDSIKNISIKL